jgi:LDH2 family malate/lactate/ureidoglycolate dehydrogenase
MVVELLCGAFAPGEIHNGNGRPGAAVIIAVDATTFHPMDAFGHSADETITRVKAVPPAKGFDAVLIPGEPEQRSKAERLAGIPVPEATWSAIVEAGRSVGVSVE